MSQKNRMQTDLFLLYWYLLYDHGYQWVVHSIRRQDDGRYNITLAQKFEKIYNGWQVELTLCPGY